jgi:predicted RNA-binding protein with PIN domain
MKILIDGYNLLNAFVASGNRKEDFEQREHLIEVLDAYRRTKKHQIILCFDAYQGLSLEDKKEKTLGVKVVYTGRGKTCDDYIKEYVEKTSRAGRLDPHRLVVITSDREIINSVQRFGIETIPSEEFSGYLEASMMLETEEGITEEDDAEWDKTGRTTKKKGPSKRLSKKERKRNRLRKKL